MKNFCDLFWLTFNKNIENIINFNYEVEASPDEELEVVAEVSE